MVGQSAICWDKVQNWRFRCKTAVWWVGRAYFPSLNLCKFGLKIRGKTYQVGRWDDREMLKYGDCFTQWPSLFVLICDWGPMPHLAICSIMLIVSRNEHPLRLADPALECLPIFLPI